MVRSTMSFRAKRELLLQVAPRYRAARHGQRSVILDEFVAVTGYERKYAIRLLLGPICPPEPIRRPTRAAVWHRGPASAGYRLESCERRLRKAAGALPSRVDPHTRAARPFEPDRPDARGAADAQRRNSGSAAGAPTSATRFEHDQAGHAAQETDPGADVHRMDRRATWIPGSRPGRALRRQR